MKNAIDKAITCLIMLVAGCAGNPNDVAVRDQSRTLKSAESVISAFYSWSPERLTKALDGVANAQPEQLERMLYYQAWAQAGNYAIQTKRSCTFDGQDKISCAITVTDDIGGALGYVATDTFIMSVHRWKIVAIDSTADDPPILQEVFDWIAQTQPEVYAGPCRGMFAGGTTPEQCVRAVVKAAQDYVAHSPE